MAVGIFFLVLTGILWVGVGAVINASARKGLSLDFIQGMGALLMMIIAAGVFFFGDSKLHPVSMVILPVAGVVNYLVFLIARKAMASGPSGLTWAIMQSSFVMPFLMGVIFFDVPCSLWRWLGITLLFASMFVMGCGAKIPENSDGGKAKKSVWLFFTLLAFCSAGLCQSCFNLGSYFIKETTSGVDNLLFRSGVNATGAFALFLLSPLWNKRAWDHKDCLRRIPLFFLCTVIATVSLFKGLDSMASCGAGAIGYPITMGSSIISFLVYTSWQLKEKLSVTAWCGVALCIAGIVLLTF